MKNAAMFETSAAGNESAATIVAFARRTRLRCGTAVKVSLIIPVEYSDAIERTPSEPMKIVANSTPMSAWLVGLKSARWRGVHSSHWLTSVAATKAASSADKAPAPMTVTQVDL